MTNGTPETEQAVHDRLCAVIARAEVDILSEVYVWRPLTESRAPASTAIACVRDKETWSEFLPQDQAAGEALVGYRVASFRFAEDGLSAIGFVAWLATALRVRGRTGAIVICGQDARRSAQLMTISQGAMDYWACPVAFADRFLDVIRGLQAEGRALMASSRVAKAG